MQIYIYIYRERERERERERNTMDLLVQNANQWIIIIIFEWINELIINKDIYIYILKSVDFNI